MRTRTSSTIERCIWDGIIYNIIFILWYHIMKKSIILFLSLSALLLTYIVWNNSLIWDTKTINDTISTGSIEIDSISSPATITGFKASGGEPFWAADFSGSTLSRSAADYSWVVITGFVGPNTSGATSVRNHTWTSTVITITSGAYTHDMSGNPCNGAINLILSGQTWKWFVGCS